MDVGRLNNPNQLGYTYSTRDAVLTCARKLQLNLPHGVYSAVILTTQLNIYHLLTLPAYSMQGLCICRASVRLSVPAWAAGANFAAGGDIDLPGVPKTSTFLFFLITLCQKLADSNIFWYVKFSENLTCNLTDLSTLPVRCSHFTLGNPKKVICQHYYSYTSDYLRYLRRKQITIVVLQL